MKVKTENKSLRYFWVILRAILKSSLVNRKRVHTSTFLVMHFSLHLIRWKILDWTALAYWFRRDFGSHHTQRGSGRWQTLKYIRVNAVRVISTIPLKHMSLRRTFPYLVTWISPALALFFQYSLFLAYTRSRLLPLRPQLFIYIYTNEEWASSFENH